MNISVTLSLKIPLEQALKKAGIEDPTTVTSLAIVGRLTDSDMRYIRENMRETLQKLDLSKASFTKNILPGHAFDNCTGLASVIFPDTIVEIGQRAFTGCHGITSFDIPASVVELEMVDICVGIWAFSECDGLTSINVHPDNPVYASIDGVLFNRDKTKLIVYPQGRQGDYVIPDSVTTIGWNAFDFCKRLTSITLLHDIPDYSSVDGVLFNKDKTRLICCPEGRQGDYVIPDTVVKIHSGIASCINLTSIFVPASVVEIGWVSELTLRFEPHKALIKEEYVFVLAAVWLPLRLTPITLCIQAKTAYCSIKTKQN